MQRALGRCGEGVTCCCCCRHTQQGRPVAAPRRAGPPTCWQRPLAEAGLDGAPDGAGHDAAGGEGQAQKQRTRDVMAVEPGPGPARGPGTAATGTRVPGPQGRAQRSAAQRCRPLPLLRPSPALTHTHAMRAWLTCRGGLCPRARPGSQPPFWGCGILCAIQIMEVRKRGGGGAGQAGAGEAGGGGVSRGRGPARCPCRRCAGHRRGRRRCRMVEVMAPGRMQYMWYTTHTGRHIPYPWALGLMRPGAPNPASASPTCPQLPHTWRHSRSPVGTASRMTPPHILRQGVEVGDHVSSGAARAQHAWWWGEGLGARGVGGVQVPHFPSGRDACP